MKFKLRAFHTVEYLAPRRRLPTRGDYLLDVDVDLHVVGRGEFRPAITSTDDMGFVETLHSHADLPGYWRPAVAPGPSSYGELMARDDYLHIKEGTFEGLHEPTDEKGIRISPETLPIWSDSNAVHVLSDDRDVTIKAAQRAAAGMAMVGDKIWVRSADPTWAVTTKFSRLGEGIEVVFTDGPYRYHGRSPSTQFFRLDRIADAERWAEMVLKRRAPDGAPADLLARRGVQIIDGSKFTRDDLVGMADGYLDLAIGMAGQVLHLLPPEVLMQWKHLRDLRDGLSGPEPRQAAIEAVWTVPGFAKAVAALRDVDQDVRALLVRCERLLQGHTRRATEMEGVGAAPVNELSDEDVASLVTL